MWFATTSVDFHPTSKTSYCISSKNSAPLIIRHRVTEVGEIVSNYQEWSSRVYATTGLDYMYILQVQILRLIIWQSEGNWHRIFRTNMVHSTRDTMHWGESFGQGWLRSVTNNAT